MAKNGVRVGWIYQPHDKRIIRDGLLIWNDMKIEYIGKYDTRLTKEIDKYYNYEKSILLPAFINGHTHIPETLLRGIVDDVKLEDWLYNHIWKIEPQMKPHDAMVGTKLGIAEMISCGTIGFVDQFYYAEEIAKSIIESGVKGFLAPSIFDDNPETGSAEMAFKRNKIIFKKYHKKNNQIMIGSGPHALYTVDLELFEEIGNFVKENNTKINTHVLETKLERENAFAMWNKSTIEKMRDMNLLDHTIAAHVVHIDDNDLKIMANSDLTISHNIQSNLKLGSGIANIPAMQSNEINIIVGTDGNASNNNLDMLEEIRTVSLVHKGYNMNPELVSKFNVIDFATINANKVFNDIYSGILEKGHWADFTIFDLSGIDATPNINPLSNLVYSISSNKCVMTVCNGNVLYENGKFHTIDIESVKKNAEKSISRMLEEANYEL